MGTYRQKGKCGCHTKKHHHKRKRTTRTGTGTGAGNAELEESEHHEHHSHHVSRPNAGPVVGGGGFWAPLWGDDVPREGDIGGIRW